MHTVALILLLLVAVVISAFLANLLPLKLPLPLLQIVLGAGLSLVGFQVRLDPHVFLFLFIPPLLFLDGWRIPKGAFFRDAWPILALAIGLVIATMIGVGAFTYWLVAAMPLTVAVALASILAPTDPVATRAILAHRPPPARLMHILNGEALLNDATGLVCFGFAVDATLTGQVALGEASLRFLLVAGGGVLIGTLTTLGIGMLNRVLVQRAGEQSSAQILVSLLIPFAAYAIADSLDLSGILAAAVAGIAMHYAEHIGRVSASTRLQRGAVWTTMESTLNGLIFVILGEQLPGMLRRMVYETTEHRTSALTLFGYVAAITAALLALRFIWVWLSMRLTLLRVSHQSSKAVGETRLMAVMAAAGVRGAVTLAGVLTLPLAMSDGAPFPSRDLAILIAMGVILLSLLIGAAALPLLTRGLESDLPSPAHRDPERQARLAAAEAAMSRIREIMAEPEPDAERADARDEAGSHLLSSYERRLDEAPAEQEQGRAELRMAAERRLRLAALEAERAELERLRRAQSIDDEVRRHLLHELDLKEASLLTRGH